MNAIVQLIYRRSEKELEKSVKKGIIDSKTFHDEDSGGYDAESKNNRE